MGPPEQPAVPEVIGQPPTAGDQVLAAAIQSKDRKATAEFVARYTDVIYRYVYSRLLPRTDQVEDLVQEVFLAAWKNLGEYRGTSSLESWLLGIARHKVEDYYRARLREAEPLETAEENQAYEIPTPNFDQLLDGDLSRRKVWRILGRLPERYRIVLLWRYWDKCSAREMAARTGKSEKAIERLLARGRAEFRSMWNL